MAGSKPRSTLANATAAGAPHRRSGRTSLELIAYRLITTLARPAAGLILRMRARRGKEDLARRGERLGVASTPRPDGALVWVHAASVGEANAALPLVGRLLQAVPGLNILLTTGTVTSARFVAPRLPPGCIHQYVPLDSAPLVRRFLDYWRPALAVFTEQEVWPNLIFETGTRNIPLALVNARMSKVSFTRWQRRARAAHDLFSRFDVVLTQNQGLADNFTALGAHPAIAVGNLKIDAPPLPVEPARFAELDTALAGRARILAASTHDGEESIIADAHRILARHVPGLLTIIAPRHPERGTAVAEALKASGFRIAQRSHGELADARTDIYVADTIGELGTLYSIAPISIIGASLVERGGHNPIEAVRHGSAVLTGPHWANFDDAYTALLAAHGAIEVHSPEDIAETVRLLLEDPVRLAAMQEQGRLSLQALSGALDRTVAQLLPLIGAQEGDVRRAS
jgi:3-deoxy-D-manno-octulosonic-acid transferase